MSGRFLKRVWIKFDRAAQLDMQTIKAVLQTDAPGFIEETMPWGERVVNREPITGQANTKASRAHAPYSSQEKMGDVQVLKDDKDQPFISAIVAQGLNKTQKRSLRKHGITWEAARDVHDIVLVHAGRQNNHRGQAIGLFAEFGEAAGKETGKPLWRCTYDDSHVVTVQGQPTPAQLAVFKKYDVTYAIR